MINDPRLASIPDTHGHAKGEHKPFAEERPIPYSARMLFLWFYHACKRGFPRFLMVADHINYLTFEDPTAVHMVRRAIKLAEAGDLYGAAETASVDVAHAKVVHEGLTRRGMRYSIGAEVDNDPRSRPDAQNIVDAMKPDAMVRSIHFLPVDHPQFGPNWFWPFDNPEFVGVFDVVGIERTWELYMAQLLEAIEKLPGHIIGHFYVPAKFGHWPEEAALEGYEDRFVAACAEHGKAIEINARLFYRPAESPELLDAYRAANLRLLRKAKAAGVGIAVGSDAHSPRDQGRGFDEVLALLDEAAVNELVFPIAGRLRQVALRATREMLDGAFPPLTVADGGAGQPPAESDDEADDDGTTTAETPNAAAGAGATPAAASRPKPRRASPKREPGKSSKRTTPSPAKPPETDSLPGAVEPGVTPAEEAAGDAPAPVEPAPAAEATGVAPEPAALEDQPAAAAVGETAPESELEEIVKAVALEHDAATASPETLAPGESTLDDPALHLNDAQRLLAASAAGNAARAAELIADEPEPGEPLAEAAASSAEAAAPTAEAETPSTEATASSSEDATSTAGDDVSEVDAGVAVEAAAESPAPRRVRPSRAATRPRTTKPAETAAPEPPAPKTASRGRTEPVVSGAKPPGVAKPPAAAVKTAAAKAGSHSAKPSAAKTASAPAKPSARAASAAPVKAAAKKKTTAAARPAAKTPARKAPAAPARPSGAAKKAAAKPAAAKRPARPAAAVAKKAPAKKTAAKKKTAKPRR